MFSRNVRDLTILIALAGITSFSLGQYAHGTAVIALPSGRQILFAADSKESRTNGKSNVDACKINAVDRKTVFIMAGLAGIGSVSLTQKAVELLREKSIHSLTDLRSVAESWNNWAIAAINESIHGDKDLFNVTHLMPVEAIFATVDDKKHVVLVTSTFEMATNPQPATIFARGSWLSTPTFVAGTLQSKEYYTPFGLRFGRWALDELREQKTLWSLQNVGLVEEIDRPGNATQKKATAEKFMSVVSPYSVQEDGTFAVEGSTDILLLEPKGVSWLSRKSNCPEIWK